jgi:hypothetical protein
VGSTHLGQFLRNSGEELKNLELFHNQYLDLEFLPDLADSCPLSESLVVDMTFYKDVGDEPITEPLFGTCLSDECIPTWALGLRSSWEERLTKAFLKRCKPKMNIQGQSRELSKPSQGYMAGPPPQWAINKKHLKRHLRSGSTAMNGLARD